MENAIDALKMAAAVLIFIIALAVAFSIIGTTKQTADSIITMRDKQAYLDSAEVDNGILYTSNSSVESGTVNGVNSKGDRTVSVDDVVSTILRYNKEKYGVTIIDNNGTVLARFDSNTEDVMRQWYNISSGLEKYIEKLNTNTNTNPVESALAKYPTPKFTKDGLRRIYEISVDGNSTIKCGAPWYGNETEIQKRIACDIDGSTYTYNKQNYAGKDLRNKLKDKKIVEVTKEIDNSTYLKDTDEAGRDKTTDLLQQYEMPTVEIIYIIL